MTENNRLKVYEQNNRISMTIWHCGSIYVNFPQSFGRCQDWIGTQFCNLALILHILSVLHNAKAIVFLCLLVTIWPKKLFKLHSETFGISLIFFSIFLPMGKDTHVLNTLVC